MKYEVISDSEWDKMPAMEETEFVVDATSHAIEGELLPPPITENKDTEDGKKLPPDAKPLSRAAIVKTTGAGVGALHWIVARIVDESEVELNKEEKKVYGEVTADLLKAYGIDLATHPKSTAWINMAVVAMEIDGPRLVLVLTRPPKKRTLEPEEGDVPPLVFPEKQ